jgi:hypothetical protein
MSRSRLALSRASAAVHGLADCRGPRLDFDHRALVVLFGGRLAALLEPFDFGRQQSHRLLHVERFGPLHIEPGAALLERALL